MGRLCRHLAAVALFASLCASPAWASDDSRRLTAEGKTALLQGDRLNAGYKLTSAVGADPNDPEALCWLGIADLWGADDDIQKKAALAELEKAKSMGATEPTIDLELGRAYFLVSRYEHCLRALASYERAQPGDWRVSQWRGIVFFRLGHYADAVNALKQALARGSKDAALCDYHLGLCYARLKRDTEGVAAFRDLERTAPGSPYAAIVRPALSAWDAALAQRERGRKPWWVRSRVSGGYDSNGIALGDDSLFNGGRGLRKDDGFFAGSLDAGYRHDFGDDLALSVFGGGGGVQYGDLPLADVDDAFVGLRLDWRPTRQVAVSFVPAYTHLWVDHDDYADQETLTPSVAYQWSDRTTSVLTYTYSHREVSLASIGPFDADGHSHTIGLAQLIRVPAWDLDVRPFFSYVWNQTEGSEYRFDGGTVGFRVSRPIAWEIVGTAGYAFSWSDYHEQSLLSPGAALTRHDHVHTGTLGLTRPLGEHVTAFFEGSWSGHESRVGFYDYERDVYTLGVEVGF